MITHANLNLWLLGVAALCGLFVIVAVLIPDWRESRAGKKR